MGSRIVCLLLIILIGAFSFARPSVGHTEVPQAQKAGHYAATAEEYRISYELGAEIALMYARHIFGDGALGNGLVAYDLSGDPKAYVFPYAIGFSGFPSDENVMRELGAARALVPQLEAKLAEVREQVFAKPEDLEWEQSTNKQFLQVPEELQRAELELEQARKSSWGTGRYGTIVVAAHRDLPPILNYGGGLPHHYTWRQHAEQAAMEALRTQAVKLTRYYYDTCFDNIFEFTCATGETVWVRLFPLRVVEPHSVRSRGTIMTEEEVNWVQKQWQLVRELLSGANPDLGYAVGPAADHFLEGRADVVPAYLWTAGCTPTAASMVLGYWDWYSPTGRYTSFGKIVSRYFERRVIENYTEYDREGDAFDWAGYPDDWNGFDGIPYSVRTLAYHMHTDAPSGATYVGYGLTNIRDGVLELTNSSCGYSFTSSEDFTTWNWGAIWDKIRAEIDATRPCIWSRDGSWQPGASGGHSVAVIGYSDGGYVYYRSTWDYSWWADPYQANGQSWANVTTAVPEGGSGGDDIELEVPDGGESWTAGTTHDIVWYQWGTAIDNVDLYYSTNGGYTLDYIGSAPSSEGWNSYAWDVPCLPSDNEHVMVVVFGYDVNTYVAGESSEDRFTIVASDPLVCPSYVSPPNGVTCQSVSGRLDWSDVSGAAGYKVQIGTSCGAGSEHEVTSSYYDYSGLNPGTTYYWRVKTKNSCGEWGSYCSCWSFTTSPGPLASPSNCVASDGDCNKIRVEWQDNSDNEDGFRVYRDGSVVGSVGANVTVWDDESVSSCQTHSYYVRAYNGCGESGSSNSDNGTRLGPPAAPTLCNATDDDTSRVRVTWQDNSSGVCGEDGFRIYRDGLVIDSVGANVTVWDDESAEYGVSYEYCVRAYNGCGESDSCCDDGMRPLLGENWFGLPEGLAGVVGQSVVIPIVGCNAVDLSGYSICIKFDPAVFVPHDPPVDTVGTVASGSLLMQYGSSDTTVSVGVIYSYDCTAPVDSGCHPPLPPYMKFVLDVREDAPIGYTHVNLVDVGLAKTRMTDCDLNTIVPLRHPGVIEIRQEAFIRGDDDGDGELTISDPIRSLCCQFGDCICSCLDASDFNDDGEVNISDPINNLCTQFGDCALPPPPFPGCGTDPTADDLGCECHPWCMGCEGVPSHSSASVNFWVGRPIRTGLGRIEYPLYVETDRPLWGFECTISYSPHTLVYECLKRDGAAGESHDFVGARAETSGDGRLRIGDLVSFDLSRALRPGVHEIGRLAFRRVGAGEGLVSVMRAVYVEQGGLVGKEDLSAAARMVELAGHATDKVSLDLVPNPTDGTTLIKYVLPANANVEIGIYNVLGQRIACLVADVESGGYHEVVWDGYGADGKPVPSGVYFCRLRTSSDRVIQKILLVR